MALDNCEGQSIAQELRAITNEAKAEKARQDEALVLSAHAEIVEKCREAARSGKDHTELSLFCFIKHESRLKTPLLEALRKSGLRVKICDSVFRLCKCDPPKSRGIPCTPSYRISW